MAGSQPIQGRSKVWEKCISEVMAPNVKARARKTRHFLACSGSSLYFYYLLELNFQCRESLPNKMQGFVVGDKVLISDANTFISYR